MLRKHAGPRDRVSIASSPQPGNRWKRLKATERSRATVRKNRFAYFLILPTVIGMLLVHFLPMVEGIYMAFLKLNQFTLSRFMGAPFVGFFNFIDILVNPDNPMKAGLAVAARNTFYYTIVVNAGVLFVAMVTALLLNRNMRGSSLARVALLLPWVVPSYVVGLLWGFMWLREQGIINYFLVNVLHLFRTPPFWLIGPNTFWAVVIPTIWRSFPFPMVTFLAALQTIPKDYYEAAEMDGASGWQRFWKITVPIMKPVIAVVLLYGLIGSVYSYNIVAMMFGNGAGYPGEWGDLMMTALQRQTFGYWNFGMGAAASVLLMLGTLGLLGVWYWVFRKDLVMQ